MTRKEELQLMLEVLLEREKRIVAQNELLNLELDRVIKERTPLAKEYKEILKSEQPPPPVPPVPPVAPPVEPPPGEPQS